MRNCSLKLPARPRLLRKLAKADELDCILRAPLADCALPFKCCSNIGTPQYLTKHAGVKEFKCESMR